jgi:hypothetical protein
MADTLPVYVLDSFAVLAHFQAESGGEKVFGLLVGNVEKSKHSNY